MSDEAKAAVDGILNTMVAGSPGVPGVVAIATNRTGNIHDGAGGKRMLVQDDAMTTDTVFAIFSTAKAITGRAPRCNWLRTASSTSMPLPRPMPSTLASFR